MARCFQCFIFCILVSYVFEFSYVSIMLRFLISTAFSGATLIKRTHLLEASTSSDLNEKRIEDY